VALKKYEDATKRVRNLLDSSGYSREFIARVFSIPRERFETLSQQEIDALPVNSSLDELARSRCYAGNERQLARYFQLKHLSAELARESSQIRSELPGDVIIGDLARNPHYGPIVSKWIATDKRRDMADAEIRKLDPVYHAFNQCKNRARVQISLGSRPSTIGPETRQTASELAREIEFRANVAAMAPKGTDIDGLFKSVGGDVARLTEKLKQGLSAAQWDFVVRGSH
jgi:hypothetical protein